MKNNPLKFIAGIIVLAMISLFQSCKVFEKEGPALTLTGSIAGGILTTSTGETVTISWVANSGAEPLQDFSIKINEQFVSGWNKKAIPDNLSETYADSASLVIPETDGSYTITLIVTDIKGKSAEEVISADVQAPPDLTLSGEVASGELTVLTGDTVTLSWSAEKGTNPLQYFSIKANDQYLDGWNNNTLSGSESDTYTASLLLVMPDTEGYIVITIIIADQNGFETEETVTITVEKPPVNDTFVYYENSNFLFIIKDGTSGTNKTRMTWEVTDYQPSTKVATISMTLDPASTGTPLPETFYFRKVRSGALEYSGNGTSWKNLTDERGDINYLFGSTASKPSALWGDVDTYIDAATVAYPGGTSTGYKVKSEYDASTNDPYFYTNYTYEYYCEETGFTKSEKFISDMQYFPIFSYKREVELVAYEINLPDGTTREGGFEVPEAPTNLTGMYRMDTELDFNCICYRKKWWMALYWDDNSDSEVQFDVYIKKGDGEFVRPSEMPDMSLSPDFFNENATSGKVKCGCGDWPDGDYVFKIKAVGAAFESDFSNELTITVN
jgi:hypothetical protein